MRSSWAWPLSCSSSCCLPGGCGDYKSASISLTPVNLLLPLDTGSVITTVRKYFCVTPILNAEALPASMLHSVSHEAARVTCWQVAGTLFSKCAPFNVSLSPREPTVPISLPAPLCLPTILYRDPRLAALGQSPL